MSGSSPAVLRLWRPAAQRNLRNQWSKLASLRHQWLSASSTARSHATSLVNSFLSLTYISSMELGVLHHIPHIRNKASHKLRNQLEQHRSKLLSSYKDMVDVVNDMVKISRSMRCFLKGPSSSPLVQFSSISEDTEDTGDGGGVPVFAFMSITLFEKLAEELVEMFKFELNLKRLIVMELISISSEASEAHETYWSNEVYPGELDCLRTCNLFETYEQVTSRLKDLNSNTSQPNKEPNKEMLQIYITAWLAEVNIDTHRYDECKEYQVNIAAMVFELFCFCRVNEIFNEVGEEMHVSLL